MPIYEYNCLDCHHEFEVMQKFSDPPLAQCPSCSGKVRKLISRSAFHLKGDGWYVTDYARKGSHNGKGKTSDDPSESSASDSGSTATTKEATKTASATDTTSS